MITTESPLARNFSIWEVFHAVGMDLIPKSGGLTLLRFGLSWIDDLLAVILKLIMNTQK
jgi:hypothetical protein